jgi:hypothetical protein
LRQTAEKGNGRTGVFAGAAVMPRARRIAFLS